MTDDRCDGARRARLNRGISLEQFFNKIPEQFWTVEEEFEFLRLITMMEIHSVNAERLNRNGVDCGAHMGSSVHRSHLCAVRGRNRSTAEEGETTICGGTNVK